MSTSIHRQVVRGAPVLTILDASIPVVRFAIAQKDGALTDPAGKAGRCRVMLELLTRGTKHKNRDAWNEAFERLGSDLEVSFENEVGMLRCVALKSQLSRTVDLVAEALHAPAFAADEREALIAEAQELLRTEREDDDQVAEIFTRRALHGAHPRSLDPYGEPSGLVAIEHDDVERAYRELLTPDGLVLVFAGDVTPEAARVFAERLLSGLPDGKASRPSLPALPEPRGTKIVLVDKPERTQVQLRVGRLTLAGGHADFEAFRLGAVTFGGTFTSTFTREVRDVRGWSYSAYADLPRRRLLRTPLTLHSAPSQDDAVDCVALELDLYRAFAEGELSDEDINFTRSYLQNRAPFDVATAQQLILPAIKNELLGLAPETLWRSEQTLEAIRNDDVRAALKKHLRADDVTVVMVATKEVVEAPLRARLPTAEIESIDYKDGLLDEAAEEE